MNKTKTKQKKFNYKLMKEKTKIYCNANLKNNIIL